jgi:hypothetical protein
MVEITAIEVQFPGPQGPRGVPRIIRDAVELGIDPYPTFYLSPNGDDDNDGLSIDTAFATYDHAVQYIDSLFWTTGLGYPALEIADGTDYISQLTNTNNGLPTLAGSAGISIYSNSGDKTTVLIDCNTYFFAANASYYGFYDITFTNLSRVRAFSAATLDFNGCGFSFSGAGYDAFSFGDNGNLKLRGACTFAFAGTPQTLIFGEGGRIMATGSWAFTGSPAFSVATVCLRNFSEGNFKFGGVALTKSGTVTGLRYSILEMSRLWVGGGGANYLPGDTNGANDGSSTYA